MKQDFYKDLSKGTIENLVEHYRREAERLRYMEKIQAVVQFHGLPEYYQTIHVSLKLINDTKHGKAFIEHFVDNFASKFARQFAHAVQQDRPDWSKLLPVPAILHCPTCQQRHQCNERCKQTHYERHFCLYHWGQCNCWKAGTLNLIGVKELP